MKKKILITGANGFIGRHLIPFFEKNYDLYGCYLEHNSILETFPSVNWIKINLKNSAQTNSIIKSIAPYGLIHLAWNVKDLNYQTSVENFEWITTSLNIIKSFGENNGKRLIIAGSCIEYNWEKTNFSEDCTHLNWKLPYANAKNSLHKITKCLSSLYNFSYVWPRIFYLYGPHQPLRCLVPSIVTSLLEEKKILCNDSSQLIDYLHVMMSHKGFTKHLLAIIKDP